MISGPQVILQVRLQEHPALARLRGAHLARTRPPLKGMGMDVQIGGSAFEVERHGLEGKADSGTSKKPS